MPQESRHSSCVTLVVPNGNNYIHNHIGSSRRHLVPKRISPATRRCCSMGLEAAQREAAEEERKLAAAKARLERFSAELKLDLRTMGEVGPRRAAGTEGTPLSSFATMFTNDWQMLTEEISAMYGPADALVCRIASALPLPSAAKRRWFAATVLQASARRRRASERGLAATSSVFGRKAGAGRICDVAFTPTTSKVMITSPDDLDVESPDSPDSPVSVLYRTSMDDAQAKVHARRQLNVADGSERQGALPVACMVAMIICMVAMMVCMVAMLFASCLHKDDEAQAALMHLHVPAARRSWSFLPAPPSASPSATSSSPSWARRLGAGAVPLSLSPLLHATVRASLPPAVSLQPVAQVGPLSSMLSSGSLSITWRAALRKIDKLHVGPMGTAALSTLRSADFVLWVAINLAARTLRPCPVPPSASPTHAPTAAALDGRKLMGAKRLARLAPLAERAKHVHPKLRMSALAALRKAAEASWLGRGLVGGLVGAAAAVLTSA